jgi:hypothetical protein
MINEVKYSKHTTMKKVLFVNSYRVCFSVGGGSADPVSGDGDTLRDGYG